MATPLALRSRMLSNSASTSLPVSAAVGSSMMITSAEKDSALAISTICICPTLSDETSSRSEMEVLTLSRSLRACRFIAVQSMLPAQPVGCRPRKMFSATVRFGSNSISWKMMLTPRSRCSWMLRETTCSPL